MFIIILVLNFTSVYIMNIQDSHYYNVKIFVLHYNLNKLNCRVFFLNKTANEKD